MQSAKGKIVGFKPLLEQWNYYALEDGMILGVKVVVSKVRRATSPSGEVLSTPDGDPIYTYNTANISQVLTPEEYKTVSGSTSSI